MLNLRSRAVVGSYYIFLFVLELIQIPLGNVTIIKAMRDSVE